LPLLVSSPNQTFAACRTGKPKQRHGCFLLKTKPINCDTASQPEPIKLLSEAKKNNATATTVYSKPANWRPLTFGAAAKNTKREQCRNKTTD